MFQTTNQSLTRGEFRADPFQNDKTRGAAPENLLAAVEMTCGRWPKRPSRSTKKNWPWRLTMIYGILWYIMVCYGILWYTMVYYYGILWYIMVYYGIWYTMVIHDHSMKMSRTWQNLETEGAKSLTLSGFDVSTAKLWHHLDGELLPTFVHGQLEHVNGNGWMDFNNNTQNQAKDTHSQVAAKEILLNCWIAEICWNEIPPNSKGPCNLLRCEMVRDLWRSWAFGPDPLGTRAVHWQISGPPRSESLHIVPQLHSQPQPASAGYHLWITCGADISGWKDFKFRPLPIYQTAASGLVFQLAEKVAFSA